MRHVFASCLRSCKLLYAVVLNDTPSKIPVRNDNKSREVSYLKSTQKGKTGRFQRIACNYGKGSGLAREENGFVAEGLKIEG